MDNGSTWKNFKNPTGTLSITANGTYNVTDYASAKVNVVTTNKVLKVYASDMVTPDGNAWFYRPKMVLTNGTAVSAIYDDNAAWSGHASTNIFGGLFNYVRQQQNVAVITPLLTDVYRLSGSSISRIAKGTAISFDCRDTQFMLIY